MGDGSTAQSVSTRYRSLLDSLHKQYLQFSSSYVAGVSDGLSLQAFNRFCGEFGLSPTPLSSNGVQWAYQRGLQGQGSGQGDADLQRYGFEVSLMAISRAAFGKGIGGEALSPADSFLSLLCTMDSSGGMRTISEREGNRGGRQSVLLPEDEHLHQSLQQQGEPSRLPTPQASPRGSRQGLDISGASETEPDHSMMMGDVSGQADTSFEGSKQQKASALERLQRLEQSSYGGGAQQQSIDSGLPARPSLFGSPEHQPQPTRNAGNGLSVSDLQGPGPNKQARNQRGQNSAPEGDKVVSVDAMAAALQRAIQPSQEAPQAAASHSAPVPMDANNPLMAIIQSSNDVMKQMQQQILALSKESETVHKEMDSLRANLAASEHQKVVLARKAAEAEKSRALRSSVRSASPLYPDSARSLKQSSGVAPSRKRTPSPSARSARTSTAARDSSALTGKSSVPAMKFSMDKTRKGTPTRLNVPSPVTAQSRGKNWRPSRKNFKEVNAHVGLGTMGLANCYLTTLQHMGVYRDLRVLYLQNNYLTSLRFFRCQPHIRELHLENNKLQTLRGLPPLPTLASLSMAGNPVASHELYRPMCLLAVGTSLLSIDGSGIEPITREASVYLGPRAGEAIYEGWLADSVRRTEREWTALIAQLRRNNAESDRIEDSEAELLTNAKRSGTPGGSVRAGSSTRGASPAALARLTRSTSASRVKERPSTPNSSSRPNSARGRPLSASRAGSGTRGGTMQRPASAGRMVGDSPRSRARDSDLSDRELRGQAAAIAFLEKELADARSESERQRKRADDLQEKLMISERTRGSTGMSANEQSLTQEIKKLETKLSRSFPAEEIVRLPSIRFDGMNISIEGGEPRPAWLAVDDTHINAGFANSDTKAIDLSVDDDVHVQASAGGFNVAANGVSFTVEHKHGAVVGRVVKLCLAYKKEKRRILRERAAARAKLPANHPSMPCPPVELGANQQ